MSSATAKNRDLRTVKATVSERPWLTERWLRRLIYECRIPYYKVGGKVLIDLTELDAFVDSGRHEAVAS